MKKLIDRGSSGEHGWSSLSRYLACPRKGRLTEEYVREEEMHYHYRGHLAHTGLAHLYARMMPRGRHTYLEPAEAVQAYADKYPSPHRDRWLEPVLRMLPHYEAHWGGDARRYEVLGVEEVVTLRVKHGLDRLPYTARYDLLVRERKTGKVYIWDHKVAYALIPKVVESYELSGQMLGLERYGRAKFKSKWGGIVLNFLRLDEKMQRDPEFARPTVNISALAVANFKHTIRYAHDVRDSFADTDTKDVPGVYNEACWGKYGPCPFRWKCTRGGA